MIGMKPARSVLADAQLCDESLFGSYYRAWSQRMAEALA
jgi:benzoate/toluate 1,2-dioxygenase alpha subunit